MTSPELPPHFSTLQAIAHTQPYPLIFATLSGAHLYGFPSPDSDYDLRGVHRLPVQDVVGLNLGPETLEITTVQEGLELDLVTHDLKKFMGLLLKRNGYVLEQLYSPLVIHTSPIHTELKAIAPHCITRHHAHHYLGFAQTQWRFVTQSQPPRIKPLLYTFRVLLSGIHLMQTGRIEANLTTLNATAQRPYLTELIARKQAGAEQSTCNDVNLGFYEQEYRRLVHQLEQERDRSFLPEESSAQAALHDLLVRSRLGEIQGQP